MTADGGGPSGAVLTAEPDMRTQPMNAPSEPSHTAPVRPTRRARLVATALLVGTASLVIAAATWPVKQPAEP